MAASTASREAFRDAVRAVLETWPVLQITVDNGFGGVFGRQKADWMVDVVQQYFHDNADLQQCEVEDYIAELMDQEFDTVADDGSLPQVSERLCQLFSQSQHASLQEFRQTVDKLRQKKSERAKVTAPPPAAEEEESEEEEEEMECSASRAEAPPPPSQEEEDGWTVVRKKK
ncbi:pre-rRNA-processing protein TSR2 homolog [Centroberyx gerrardi]